MVYHKTHEGRAALRERGTLTLRERQLMVLFNGSRTLKELADLFGAGVTADVDRLERQGFIVGRPDGVPLESRFGQLASREPEILTASARSPANRLETPPTSESSATPRISLEELANLAEVPPPRFAAQADTPYEQPAATQSVATAASAAPDVRLSSTIYSIVAEPLSTQTPLAAQAYMTQVLMALDTEAASALIETSVDMRHDVEILLYVAQGLGHTYAMAGEDVALRVAMRASRLLPGKELPMLLDCTLDYVPNSFSVLLYEFVLAGRDTGM